MTPEEQQLWYENLTPEEQQLLYDYLLHTFNKNSQAKRAGTRGFGYSPYDDPNSRFNPYTYLDTSQVEDRRQGQKRYNILADLLMLPITVAKYKWFPPDPIILKPLDTYQEPYDEPYDPAVLSQSSNTSTSPANTGMPNSVPGFNQGNYNPNKSSVVPSTQKDTPLKFLRAMSSILGGGPSGFVP